MADKTIAWLLTGVDNDSRLFDFPDKPTAISYFCPACGYRMAGAPPDTGMKLRRRYDVSFTYDNACVVSRAVLDVLADFGLTAADYKALDTEGYFYLYPGAVLPFDAARRKTRFDKPCAVCGRYESVTGATPVFLLQAPAPSAHVYRTDVEFGSGNEKAPLIILDNALGLALRAVKPKGAYFEPIPAGHVAGL